MCISYGDVLCLLSMEMGVQNGISLRGEFVSLFQIFELLLSFCSVNSIRCLVCHSLLKSSALQDPVRYKILLSEPQAHLSEPFFAVVHWAAQSVETHDSAPLLALEFLKEIYLVINYLYFS